jgi:16S rRNA G1207 methylase RsmC
MDINKKFLEDIQNTQLICDDFLKISLGYNFDYIIANPPFSKNQDIDHVYKMYECLKVGGRLVSITSKHWQISNNKKETDFKNWLNKTEAEIHEIESGTFKESGTAVGGLIVIITKKNLNL